MYYSSYSGNKGFTQEERRHALQDDIECEAAQQRGELIDEQAAI
jgi:hypothetical protein